MQVSVIIAAYNAEKFLAETLDSVRAQTHQDWELILVNDGSRDQTEAIAQAYAARDPRMRIVSQANGGVSAARNRGIDEVCQTSEAVTFLDGDDLWMPDALETMVGALEANPAALAAHAVALYVDEQGRPSRLAHHEDWGRERSGLQDGHLIDWPAETPTTFMVLACFNCIPVGAVIIRRAALEAVGHFDLSLTIGEDWDLWLRLSRRGDIAFADRIVLHYRQHAHNATGQKRSMRQGELILARKLVTSGDNTPEQAQIARLGYRCRERHYGALRLRWARDCWGCRSYIEAAKQLRHAANCYWHSATGAM